MVMERLTFNIGSSRSGPPVVAGRDAGSDTTSRTPAPASFVRASRAAAAVHDRYDWDSLWMLAFTTLLFFRPQDIIPGLGALHLAELTAIGGLAAMAVRRMGAGQTITHVNPELVGVLTLGGILLLTMPFSIWP